MVNNIKKTINEVKYLVSDRFIVLDNIYKNAHNKMRFKCVSCGFINSKTYNNVQQGYGCLRCSGKIFFSDVIKYCKLKNIKCLDNKYSPYNNKFKCLKDNYVWEAQFSIMKWSNRGCPKCAKNFKKSNSEIESILKSKNLMCDEIIKNTKSKVILKCLKCNFTWGSSISNIKNSKFNCPNCYNVNGMIIPSITEIKILLNNKGISLMSTEYKNAHSIMKFKCNKCNNIWKTSYNKVKRGTGCPICSKGKSENECRRVFEKIYNQKFPSIRPDWLKSDNGKNLELDGYNKKLKLAFEYDGEQHFKWKKHIHPKEILFINQVKRDRLKDNLCKKVGVTLIRIPYNINFLDIEKYIINKINFYQ